MQVTIKIPATPERTTQGGMRAKAPARGGDQRGRPRSNVCGAKTRGGEGCADVSESSRLSSASDDACGESMVEVGRTAGAVGDEGIGAFTEGLTGTGIDELGGRKLGEETGATLAGGGSKRRALGGGLVGGVPEEPLDRAWGIRRVPATEPPLPLVTGDALLEAALGAAWVAVAGLDLLDHHPGIFSAPAFFGTFSELLSMSSKRAAASFRLLVAIGAPRLGEAQASCLRDLLMITHRHCISLRQGIQQSMSNVGQELRGYFVAEIHEQGPYCA